MFSSIQADFPVLSCSPPELDDITELRYPWQGPLQEAVLESDREKLAEKALEAETLIFERLQQLQLSNNDNNDRAAIEDALSHPTHDQT